jgi:hypothetical protein
MVMRFMVAAFCLDAFGGFRLLRLPRARRGIREALD